MKHISTTLAEAELAAREQCGYTGEEQGGFIIQAEDSFEFVKVSNMNTGDPIAPVLYTADPNEFGALVHARRFETPSWRLYASFHTHPGCSTTPSSTDLRKLFCNFQRHYIYAPLGKRMTLYTLHQEVEARRLDSPRYPAFTHGSQLHNQCWVGETFKYA